MLQLVKGIFKAYRNACRIETREELYRDEFESEAFASGEFKGIRFTRLESGEYADARLESTWRSYVREAMQIDDVV